jgi:hypothetical protein
VPCASFRKRFASSARRSSRISICLKRRRCMSLLLSCWRKAGARPAFSITDVSHGPGGDGLSVRLRQRGRRSTSEHKS